MDEIRITKGLGRYITNFSVASYPFADQINLLTDPDILKVSLLLHFDGKNDSNFFFDASPVENAITPYGNAKLSSAQKKFGNTAGYFDGNGDYLKITGASSLNLYQVPFTIEMWVYLITSKDNFLIGYNNTTLDFWDLYIDSSNKVVFRYNGNSGNLTSTASVSIRFLDASCRFIRWNKEQNIFERCPR